jgi:hypothetical protein
MYIRKRMFMTNQTPIGLVAAALILCSTNTSSAQSIDAIYRPKATLGAIAKGHPAARIDELMPWNFDKPA